MFAAWAWGRFLLGCMTAVDGVSLDEELGVNGGTKDSLGVGATEVPSMMTSFAFASMCVEELQRGLCGSFLDERFVPGVEHSMLDSLVSPFFCMNGVQ